MENNQNQLERKQSIVSSTISQIRNGIKIRDLKDDNPIKEALAYVFVLIGLATDKQPKGIEKQVLIDFMIGAYGSLIAEEIKTAFKLAVKGQFKGLDTNCYQNFNCEYLGRVMACYYVWRAEEFKNPKNQLPPPPPEKFDVKQYYEDKLLIPYEKYTEDGKYLFSDLDGQMMFDSLYRLGYKIEMSDEERQAFIEEATRLTPPKKRDNPLDPPETEQDLKRRIMKRAKSLKFKSWIEECSFAETNLRAIIEVLVRK
jgi:hypothetical protein